MHARLVLATVPLAVLGVAVAPSLAAPKKPIEKSYTASAPVPGGSFDCAGTIPDSAQLDEFKVPAAGKLQVDLSGFLGDWDMAVTSGGAELGVSQNIQPLDGDTESVSLKFKKATPITIAVCNYNGGPTGDVKLKFTYS